MSDKIDSRVKALYDAMLQSGADVGTAEEFNTFFFQPGDQGYRNRKAVYEAFKAEGADVGENYEEFRDWLQLAPAKKASQTQGATSKPAATTMAASEQEMTSASIDKLEQLKRNGGENGSPISQAIEEPEAPGPGNADLGGKGADKKDFWSDPNTNIHVNWNGSTYLVPSKEIDYAGGLSDWEGAYQDGRMLYPMAGPNGERREATIEELDELKKDGWLHLASKGEEIREDLRLPETYRRGYRVKIDGKEAFLPFEDVRYYKGLEGWAKAHPEVKLRVLMNGADGKTYSVPVSRLDEFKSKPDWKFSMGDATEEQLAEYFEGRDADTDGIQGADEGWVNRNNEFIEKIWQEAESKFEADKKKNAEKHWKEHSRRAKESLGGLGGREMRTVTSSENALDDMASRYTRFDLQSLMDETWKRNGGNMTEECYRMLKAQYPRVSNRELKREAKSMARQMSDTQVYEYAVKMNVPKNTLDFFVKTVMDHNSLVNLTKGLARIKAGGKTGDMAAEEQAMAEFGKDHRVAQILGGATGIVADPVTTLSGGAGGAAAKGMAALGGKIVAAGTRMTSQMGRRLFLGSTTGRFLSGMAGGGGNFMFFEGAHEGVDQFKHGGHINPQTGENEGFSIAEISKAAGKGALLGSVMGAGGVFWGNVADKGVRAASSTAGKTMAKVGAGTAGFVTEGAVLAAPELFAGEGDPVDILVNYYATIIGIKGIHAPKTASEVINGLRTVKPKAGRELTQEERNNNRMGYAERFRKQLEKVKDVKITTEMKDELREKGYDTDLLFGKNTSGKKRNNKDLKAGGDAEAEYIEAESGRIREDGEFENSSFDGFDEMERLVNDENVSEETRAAMYYIFSGNKVNPSTIVGYRETENEDGSTTVETLSTTGAVVTRRRLKGKDLKGHLFNVGRQIELNTIDVGERYADARAGETNTENSAQIKERINAARKVDIDEIIRKTQDRTEAEREALDEYVRALYPEEALKSDMDAAAEGVYNEARELYGQAEQGDPEAQGAMDDIVARFKDAEREFEETFRDEADVYIAEMEENPWGVVMNPELDEAQREAALNYVNSKFALQGAMDASEQSAEGKINAAREEVERRVNRQTGMVQPAKLAADGSDVYIYSGEIKMFEDGSGIDKGASSDAFIILDPRTNEYRWANIDMIESAGEGIDPEVEIERASQAIREEAGAPLKQAEAMKDEYDRGADEARGILAQVDDEGLSAIIKEFAEKGELTQEERGFMDVLVHEELRRANKSGTEGPSPRGERGAETDLSSSPARDGDESGLTAGGQTEASDETALGRMPKDEQGNPLYDEAEADMAWDAIVEQSGGDVEIAAEVVADELADRKKALSEAEKELKKVTDGKPEKGKAGQPAPSIAERIAAKTEAKKALAGVQAKRDAAKKAVEHWENITGTLERRQAALEAEKAAEEARLKAEQEAEAKRLEEEKKALEEFQKQEKAKLSKIDRALGKVYDTVKDNEEATERLRKLEPETMEEAASVVLSGNKLLWSPRKDKYGSPMSVKRGVKEEVGFGEGERRRFFGMFAAEENGGKTLARLAEDAMEEVCKTYGIPYDNQAAYNALIEVMRTADSPSAISRLINRNRADQALEIKERADERAARELREAEEEAFYMTFGFDKKEYDAYNEHMMQEAEEALSEFDDGEFYGAIVDEITDREKMDMEYLLRQDENFDESEFYGNIADENILRNGKRNEGEASGESEPEAGRNKETESEGEGSSDGRGGEIQQSEESGEGRGAGTDAERPGIRGEGGTPIADRHAELGSGAGTEGISPTPNPSPQGEGNSANGAEAARRWLEEKRRGTEEIKEEIAATEFMGPEEGSYDKAYADALRDELTRREEENKALREAPEYKPLYDALDELQKADKAHFEAMKQFDDRLEREKWAARKEAREEADKEFDRLTDDELTTALEAHPEIREAFGRDGLMEYSRTADRLKEIARAKELQAHWENTADLPQVSEGAKEPRKAKMTDFTAPKNSASEPLKGVYHDEENGFAVSSDTHVLVASKDAYDASKAGKVVYGSGKNQTEEARPLGKGGYPNYLRVIPKGEAKAIAPLSVRRISEIERTLHEALKGLENKNDRENATVMVRMPDGHAIAFCAQIFKKFLSAARMLGNGSLEYWGTNRPMSVRDANGAVVGIPILLEEEPTWKIDLGSGSNVVAEPGAGYSRRGRSQTGAGLFDWRVAPGQQSLLDLMEGGGPSPGPSPQGRGEGPDTARTGGIFAKAERIGAEAVRNSKKGREAALRLEREKEAEREFEALAEQSDEAIDRFQAEFAAFRMRGLEYDIEREEAQARIGEIEQTARDEERELTAEELEEIENLEGRIEELDIAEQREDEAFAEERDRLEEILFDFYSRNNKERDARDIARETVQRAMAEVEMMNGPTPGPSPQGEGNSANGEGEVKTAGGVIRYEGLGHLPNTEKGEFAYAERVFTLSGGFDLTGSEKIEDRGDVAFLFKALETKAVEHVFAVFVKDGRPRVVHVSMGGQTMSIVDNGKIRAGFEAFGADEIYLVHNHPSGKLIPSPQDLNFMRLAEAMFDGKAKVRGLIIDTESGRYSEFSSQGRAMEYERPKEVKSETHVATYSFDEGEKIGDQKGPKITGPDGISDYIRGLRFKNEDKLSYLILNNDNEIIGLIHTDYENVGNRDFAEEVVSSTIKYNGKSAVVFGSGRLSYGLNSELRDNIGELSGNEVRLLDVMQISNTMPYRSAQNEGLMEPEAEYAATPEEAEEANKLYNEELEKWDKKEMDSRKYINAGKPSGILRHFLPDLPIIMTQRVAGKARKKHGLSAMEMRDLPKALSKPIFVFKKNDNSIGVLTVLKNKEGENIFVAINLGSHKQMGHQYIDVNDIVSVHGREVENIISPILENDALQYADKKKGLEWLSSAELNPQAIAAETFDDVAKIIDKFENPKIKAQNIYEKTAHSLSVPNFPSGESDYGGIIDAKLADFFERAKNNLEKNEGSDSGVRFSIRKEAAPKKTGIGYKVFVLKDGKLYPPMVANPGGEATPVGVWLNADAAPQAGTSKTGRPQVKAGGKGTQGGSGKLAYRPGWHLGEIPYALQFNRKGESGAKDRFPGNFVWAKVEYANDVDYQKEATEHGMNANGKYQHSLAGLPRVPENGSYRYRTNPNPETDPWIITGAMKVNRILTPTEVDMMVIAAGREPQKRQLGAVTDAEVEALNKELGLSESAPGDKPSERGVESAGEIAEVMTEMAKATGVPVEIVDSREALAQRDESNGAPLSEGRAVAGYTKDGKIILNAEAMDPDTPLHEYTHLWNDMVRRENPKLWERGKELLKETPEWQEVMNDPEYAHIRDNEDAVADEVSSRYTGKRGQERMEEMIREARKQGPIAEAEAISLVYRIKRWLQEMFKGLKKTLGKWTKRDLKDLTLEEFSNMTLRDFVEGLDPRHGDRTMAGLHNISESKLRKVLKNGGLANPSAAVIDLNTQSHENYGDITLVMPKDMVEKRSGRNAGTWIGDAWTPMYPKVEKDYKDHEGYKRFYEDTERLPEEHRSLVQSGWTTYLQEGNPDYLAPWYLIEKNRALPERIYYSRDEIRKQGLENDFEKWVEEKERLYGIEEKLFAGYTPSGTPKYVANTVENASRLMKRQGRAGSAGIKGSYANFVSRAMSNTGKTSEIRKQKGRLATERKEVDFFDEKHREIYMRLADKCMAGGGGLLDESGYLRLNDAAGEKDPARYLREKYKIELTDAEGKELNDLVKSIREERPAMYFETKFERPVMLNEFAAAVVPEHINPELSRALEEAGLKVVKYNPEIKGDRRRATLEATDSGEVRFAMGGRTETLEEIISNIRQEAQRANSDRLQEKKDAIRAIGGNLGKLRQAMARQREYDYKTVKALSDMAEDMMEKGLLDNLSNYEIKRILGSIKQTLTGPTGGEKAVKKILDILIDNQLKNSRNAFSKLLSLKGSKVDTRGVEVQGVLDPDGQKIASVVKKATMLNKEEIEERMADALDRMDSKDSGLADEAALEYQGLQTALQYADNIKGSKTEEQELRRSIAQAEAEYKAGEGGWTKDSIKQYKEATEEAIRENKIERAESYQDLIDTVGSMMAESIERAREWREAEKERVNEIHHNANSDMEGRPTDEHHKNSKVQKMMNNSVLRFFLAPLATFDQMLRMFGNKNARGEGYLWNRFMRGWVNATENEYKGYQQVVRELDDKVREIFGARGIKKWSDLYSLDRKLPKCTVKFWDGGEMKDHELTQGNLAYIYMVNKMTDGKMKLRSMGITEEEVSQIAKIIDPDLLKLADWIQDEYLPEKRQRYNDVHKRMFGTSMASIENYFPLKVLKNARTEEVDVTDDLAGEAMPSTATGSIIKRKRNNLALDITGANMIKVVVDHLQEMEHWGAFAEYNRDLNTLLSYKRFRNQVKNMDSAYGAGETLWNNFRNVSALAAGAYRPPVAILDKAAVNMSKGVTAAKVSARVFTALKQFLSMPAYLSDANPYYLIKNLSTPVGAWKWGMENLPIFEKRWKSRMAGDPRLMKTEMDWKAWKSKIAQLASRWGMSPNAFVDALTVSIGARSMYETRKARYLRLGMEEQKAEKRAKEDATILFNQTQQSSESAFLSTIQVDRSWPSVVLTVFRNSSMSYTRQLYDAMRNLGRRMKPGYREESISFMAKQFEREGVETEKAKKAAETEYNTGMMRDLARVGVFGYILQMAWNIGAYLPYLIIGNDEKDKEEMIKEALQHALFGGLEGLTAGDALSAAGNQILNHDISLRGVAKDMPSVSDLEAMWEKFGYDELGAVNDMVNLLVQSGVGINPETLTDIVVAIVDHCGSDKELQQETALVIARVLNCPPSQLDKVYFDEIDASAREASEMTADEIAERYAEYKMMREAPLTGWMRSEENKDSVMDRKKRRVLTQAKEKVAEATDEKTGFSTPKTEAEYKRLQEKAKEISDLKKTDFKAGRRAEKEWKHTEDYWKYRTIQRYRRDMDGIIDRWIHAKDGEEKEEMNELMQLQKRRLMEIKHTGNWRTGYKEFKNKK